jgi:16S rRNA (guanine966-N2)-methyltransferase
VRIIAGTHRGHRIAAPKGRDTRPTSDRVRENAFNLIGPVDDADVLDLFAGSGAMGLEALSRGAASATFVENSSGAAKAIKRNAEALGASDRVQIFGGSALALPRSEPFDLILADPPYSPGSGSAAVQAVVATGWLAAGGWMSVETARGDSVDPLGLTVEAARDVGRDRLSLLRRP